MTTVSANHFVDCPFSAAIEFAQGALDRREDVTLSPAPLIAHDARLNTQTANDLSDSARLHDALLLAWRPRTALFPQFHGALTVRPKRRGSHVRLLGSYEPPGGAFGHLFDVVLGRYIARLTLRRLLHELGMEMEKRWRAFREETRAT